MSYFANYNDFVRWCNYNGYDPEFIYQYRDTCRGCETAYIKHADDHWKEVFFLEDGEGDVWHIYVFPHKLACEQEIVQFTRRWVNKGVDD